MSDVDRSKPELGKRRVTRLFAAIFLPVSLAIAVLLFSIYRNELKTLERVGLARAQTHMKVLSERLADEFGTALSDLGFLSGKHEMSCFLDDDSSHEKELLEDLSLFSRTSQRYDQIRYIDATGKEAIRINYKAGEATVVADTELQNKGTRYYFKDTIKLDRGQVFISPLDLNIEYQQIEHPLKPILRFGTPVFNSVGEKKGIVIINYFAERMLNVMHETDAQFFGSFQLINPDGYWLHCDDPSREWAFMYQDMQHVSIASEFPQRWEAISSADVGELTTPNGKLLFSTVRPLPTESATPPLFSTDADYRWTLMAEIPFSVIRSQANRLARILLLILIVFVSFAAIISYAIASASIRRKVAAEYNEELITQLRRSLDEIGTLRGIIPICSSCKKVRNSDGYFEAVESYISTHTDADFSHTLCDRCFKKDYPDIFEEFEQEREQEKTRQPSADTPTA